MILEQQCPICGKEMEIPIDDNAYKTWKAGTLIQNAFPALSPAERETIKTGYCFKCQEILFHPPEE